MAGNLSLKWAAGNMSLKWTAGNTSLTWSAGTEWQKTCHWNERQETVTEVNNRKHVPEVNGRKHVPVLPKYSTPRYRNFNRFVRYAYNSRQEKKWTLFGRTVSTTSHHLPTAIQSTMEITHWTHDRHQTAKTNNVIQTTREEIIGKTAKTLVWDRNGPPGPKRERMMMIVRYAVDAVSLSNRT
jgi:hypothetical protein